MRTLNPVIARDIAARLRRRWAAPSKPGLVDVRLKLSHTSGRGACVDNAGPLRDEIEQHRPLLLVHVRSFEALGLYGLAVLPRTEHEIGHTVTQNGLAATTLVQGVQQRERLVALSAERPHRLSVDRIESRLSAGQCRSKNALLSGDGDIQRQVVPAKLQHPGSFFRRRSKDGDEIQIPSEHRATASPALRTASSAARLAVASLWWSVARTGRCIACRSSSTPVAVIGFEDLVGIDDLLDLL